MSKVTGQTATQVFLLVHTCCFTIVNEYSVLSQPSLTMDGKDIAGNDY